LLGAYHGAVLLVIPSRRPGWMDLVAHQSVSFGFRVCCHSNADVSGLFFDGEARPWRGDECFQGGSMSASLRAMISERGKARLCSHWHC